MMGIRVVCFVVTVVMFVTHAGWLTVIPAVGAIALPYFAVVVANSRRPSAPSGFRPYQPRLPERYVPPGDDSRRRAAARPAAGRPLARRGPALPAHRAAPACFAVRERQGSNVGRKSAIQAGTSYPSSPDSLLIRS